MTAAKPHICPENLSPSRELSRSRSWPPSLFTYSKRGREGSRALGIRISSQPLQPFPPPPPQWHPEAPDVAAGQQQACRSVWSDSGLHSSPPCQAWLGQTRHLARAKLPANFSLQLSTQAAGELRKAGQH